MGRVKGFLPQENWPPHNRHFQNGEKVLSHTTDKLEEYVAELEERLAKINWILDDYSILDKVRQIKEVMRK